MLVRSSLINGITSCHWLSATVLCDFQEVTEIRGAWKFTTGVDKVSCGAACFVFLIPGSIWPSVNQNSQRQFT